MVQNTIYVDEKSDIPLIGVDFLGVIDRGTNVIELKPLTICNLKCKYCFVSAGDYSTNFIVDSDYLIKKVNQVINIKGKHDIEIHIAPYGEVLLYPELYKLIENLWKIPGVERISMQSNGLLLNKKNIQELNDLNLSRINISLNTLNEALANQLCNCQNYNIENMLKNIELLLKTNINVLIAPVWFPGKNDGDIEEIIELVKSIREKGYSQKKIQIGIQKYLIYKTGRKLKNTRTKSWSYFYTQLSKLQKKYNIKLKLGPLDFGIHKRKSYPNLELKKGALINFEIVSKGRWKKECIGKINDDQAIKILLQKPFYFSEKLIGKRIEGKVIKANYRDNILTATFPIG
jgi:uncharacterized Fe-S cluster-containing radical SAM superfamily enzyme